MNELLGVALAFPTVVFTVLLGVVLVYWLFVVMGAVHIDLLGGAAHGTFEGSADAAADGAMDAAMHHAVDGVLDGASKGVAEAGAEQLHMADNGGVAHALGSLKLRSAPATVVSSLLVTFSWLVSVLAIQGLQAFVPSVAGVVAGVVVLVVAPLVALPMTSLAVRPLAPLFVPHQAKGNRDLVGRVCVVRTGTVDDTFGEATLEDGGAGLVVRVRVDGMDQLQRGDQALIVAWDEDRQTFTVAPMDDMLRRP
ncbi:MAG: hypothetical protein WCI05_12955 [Myxococcales bacterium]